ncbi:MAG: phosphotransferase [Sulfurovum sp.]|nr:phosphotransferase [Sulfurovum sp.]MCB4776710.1 phosphotransferase [Sulfurovum sp.]
MKNKKPNIKLTEWLEHYKVNSELIPLAGDASFRKYYRVADNFHRGIVMDASMQPESVEPFINIAHLLFETGVRTPKINAFDAEQGFIFMEDVGNTHFYDVVETEKETIYPKAIDTIVKMQYVDVRGLPLYDHDFLFFEMELMEEWYLKKYLSKILSVKEKTQLNTMLDQITNVVLEQPQGFFVHRDYHSRNLMFNHDDALVVIDFQDARVGSLTYDLVSLLRDVYVELDPKEVEQMALYFRDAKRLNVDDATFMKWFDFTGLQRHIKILGIFARLALRDGKESYLKNIPMTLKYIMQIVSKYDEINPLKILLDTTQ